MQRPNIVMFVPDHFRGDMIHHLGNASALTPNIDAFAESHAVSFPNAFCQNTVCIPSRCSFMSGWYPHVRGHRTMRHVLQRDEQMLLRDLKENGYHVWWGGKNHVVPEDEIESCCSELHRPERVVADDGTSTCTDKSGRRLRPMWMLDREEAWRGRPGSPDYYSFYRGKLDGTDGMYYDQDWFHVLGAVDFLDRQPQQPFCLYLPLVYPHAPYAVEEPWYSMADRKTLPPRIPTLTPLQWSKKSSMLRGIFEGQGMQRYTEEQWNELRGVLYGMCARVDHQFGMIVEALRRNGLFDDTAVLFFSDHGDYAGDYGVVEICQNTFEDSMTRVPLIIKGPGAAGHSVRDELVELLDLPATIAEMTGIKLTHTGFGRSLVPLLRGESTPHRDAVFCEGGRLPGELQAKEFLQLDPCAVGLVGMHYPRLSLQAGDGIEHLKAVMCRTKTRKLIYRMRDTSEFYDLELDPSETNNLIDDPLRADEIRAMKDRILQFYIETGDVVPPTLYATYNGHS